MASTYGGMILLSVEEKGDCCTAVGVLNADKVVQDLCNGVHNPERTSASLLTPESVRRITESGVEIVLVTVRQARWEERPVHVGKNPLGGTYLRRNEGDCRPTDEQVRRMLAECVEDARDAKVLENYDVTDLDLESVVAYCHRFSAVKPGHMHLDLSTLNFSMRSGHQERTNISPRRG